MYEYKNGQWVPKRREDYKSLKRKNDMNMMERRSGKLERKEVPLWHHIQQRRGRIVEHNTERQDGLMKTITGGFYSDSEVKCGRTKNMRKT